MHRIPSLTLALVASVASLTPIAAAQVGSPYCFGTSCPCGNDDPQNGCGNFGFDGSSTTGAGLVHAGGGSSVVADNLIFAAFGMQPNQFGLLYTGQAAIELPFGDGKRCVGAGGGSIFRFPLRQAGAFGDFSESGLVATSQSFGAGGEILAGSTWYYQWWYRDPGGPCGSQFNLTNAYPVTWSGGSTLDHDQLAGNPLPEYPHFEYVRAINQGSPVNMAFDPALRPDLSGQTADVYIVEAKTVAEWTSDDSLVDVTLSGATTITFNGTDVQSSTYLLDIGSLLGTVGTDIGVGYDVVIDLDQDGRLDPDEPIDGYGDEAGFYVVRDTTAGGPYSVIETIYSGGTWLGQDLYYPSNIASLGEVPLIVVSHGNGHNYQWYDHIGYHMASYGYVVMSHQNNTQPGIETASTTTLTNTDYLLGNLGSIAGGALLGHIDSSRITWIGHSRGGEGVVRAYTRINTGAYTPANYTASDIQLVSSIAPVTFLGPGQSNPDEVNYHMWVGSADADVTGFGGSWPFAMWERSQGEHHSIALQGVGHGAFHDGGGSLVASGPCLVSRADTHDIMRGHFLPLVKYHIDGDIPSKDFLWRQYESFRPIGAPVGSCIVATLDHKEHPDTAPYVIDDYETQTSTSVSSSGGSVSFSVSNVVEANMRDTDGQLTWTGSEPMNGMTRANSGDTQRGVVFDWNGPAFYELSLPVSGQDFTPYQVLSFRACQGTRHPLTIAALEDLTFQVTLRDSSGNTGSISCGAYGGGIEEPYQRTGFGTGAGWANEFEVIRIRLTDFAADGSGIDLSSIEAVRFDFGGAGESPEGRIGLDDVMLTGI